MAELKPHEQRVVAEYKELRERHAKLYSFIASGAFITLPEEDRELMVIQENLMDALSFVLARRIRRFSAAAAGVAVCERAVPVRMRFGKRASEPPGSVQCGVCKAITAPGNGCSADNCPIGVKGPEHG